MGDKGKVVTGRVAHPGMAARPFMRPGFDSAKGAAEKAMGAVYRKAVESVGGGRDTIDLGFGKGFKLGLKLINKLSKAMGGGSVNVSLKSITDIVNPNLSNPLGSLPTFKAPKLDVPSVASAVNKVVK